jgi:hypothetical protein
MHANNTPRDRGLQSPFTLSKREDRFYQWRCDERRYPYITKAQFVYIWNDGDEFIDAGVSASAQLPARWRCIASCSAFNGGTTPLNIAGAIASAGSVCPSTIGPMIASSTCFAA